MKNRTLSIKFKSDSEILFRSPQEPESVKSANTDLVGFLIAIPDDVAKLIGFDEWTDCKITQHWDEDDCTDLAGEMIYNKAPFILKPKVTELCQ